jgi:hypothetical protein
MAGSTPINYYIFYVPAVIFASCYRVVKSFGKGGHGRHDKIVKGKKGLFTLKGAL